MSKLRKPNSGEILAANRRSIDQGLRQGSDIIPLPPHFPIPYDMANVGEQYGMFYVDGTTYRVCARLQIHTTMSGWLNMKIYHDAAVGYGGYAKFTLNGADLWVRNFNDVGDDSSASTYIDCSTGYLDFQLRSNTAGQRAWARVELCCLASRPFYTIV